MNLLLNLISILNVVPIIMAWRFTGLVVSLAGTVLCMKMLGNLSRTKLYTCAGVIGTVAGFYAFNNLVITLLIGLINITLALVPDKS